MKKIIPIIFAILLLLSVPAFATDYYNCNSLTLSTSHWNTASASCGTGDAVFGSSGFPASGSVLHANSYTITVDTNPSPNYSTLTGTVTMTYRSTSVTGAGTSFTTQVAANDWIWLAANVPAQVSSVTNDTTLVLTMVFGGTTASGTAYDGLVTLSTVTGSGSAGGGFTYGNALGLTLYAVTQAGTTTCLTISGTSGTSTLINPTLGSTTTNTIAATMDNRTGAGGTATAYGIFTGGTTSNDYGFRSSGNGTLVLHGPMIAGTASGAHGVYNQNSTANALTAYGDAYGSDTVAAAGLALGSGVYAILYGNVFDGKVGTGYTGSVYWKPTASQYRVLPISSSASLGVISAYTLVVGPVSDGTSYNNSYLAAAQIASGSHIADVVGSASAGGGGAF
jgi:hypothetical protein